MRPNPNYFHLRAGTTITLNERFSRLNQKKPSSFSPPIRRGGIQKPRTTNLRNLRGRLNQMEQNRQNTYNNNVNTNATSASSRGSISGRRGLSRPTLNRGARAWQNSASNNTFGTTAYRGSFRGRGGLNLRGRGGRRPITANKKTPQQTKQELDDELDKYMNAD